MTNSNYRAQLREKLHCNSSLSAVKLRCVTSEIRNNNDFSTVIADHCWVWLPLWMVGYNPRPVTSCKLYHVCQPLVGRWAIIFVKSGRTGRQFQESVVFVSSRGYRVRVRLQIAVWWDDLRCECIHVRFVAAQGLSAVILWHVRPGNESRRQNQQIRKGHCKSVTSCYIPIIGISTLK